MKHQMYFVRGMTCENCVKKITEVLGANPSIKNLRVTLSPPRIHFDAEEQFGANRVNEALAPLKDYTASEFSEPSQEATSAPAALSKYMPLILLFGLSAGVPALNVLIGRSDLEHWMNQFMGITLIALAYFKFLDLPRFAEAFSTYDPIAMKNRTYGYVYPFLELFTGVGFALSVGVEFLAAFVILLLVPTTWGVVKSLRQNRKIQCACLGTAFNLPLTKVTIIENVLMMGMSLMILLD